MMMRIHFNFLFEFLFRLSPRSYDTSSRRKQSDRSKRSHHRRSPTSSRHGHRQRHNRDNREDRDDRSHSTSRRRHRDRVVKDRSPVKVKTIRFYSILHLFVIPSNFCLTAKIAKHAKFFYENTKLSVFVNS